MLSEWSKCLIQSGLGCSKLVSDEGVEEEEDKDKETNEQTKTYH